MSLKFAAKGATNFRGRTLDVAPGDGFGWGGGGVDAEPLAVLHAEAGHRHDEAPVADDEGVGPVGEGGHLGAEEGGAAEDLVFGFVDGGPPDLVEVVEVVGGPGGGEGGAGAADVAGEGVAFADDGVDDDG